MAKDLAGSKATNIRLPKPKPCMICSRLTYLANEDGPAHPCCVFHREMIEAGRRCPSCNARRR